MCHVTRSKVQAKAHPNWKAVIKMAFLLTEHSSSSLGLFIIAVIIAIIIIIVTLFSNYIYQTVGF